MGKSRFKLRENLMIAIYQHLITADDFLICLDNNKISITDPFVEEISRQIMKNTKLFIKNLDKQLTDWTFDRLGRIEQAILLLAYAEINGALNDKAVVINEAVNLTKIYCDEDSYKIINATLDKL